MILATLAMTTGAIIGLVIGVVVLLILIAILFGVLPIKIWFRSLVSGVKISRSKLIGRKWRGIKVTPLVDAYISAKKAGLDIS
ncbi:MAG: flotillin-like FloA family protein, partial [Clostridia bacterium]|nr:flotillin-like FloA family protein [Clostridia bacterium]